MAELHHIGELCSIHTQSAVRHKFQAWFSETMGRASSDNDYTNGPDLNSVIKLSEHLQWYQQRNPFVPHPDQAEQKIKKLTMAQRQNLQRMAMAMFGQAFTRFENKTQGIWKFSRRLIRWLSFQFFKWDLALGIMLVSCGLDDKAREIHCLAKEPVPHQSMVTKFQRSDDLLLLDILVAHTAVPNLFYLYNGHCFMATILAQKGRPLPGPLTSCFLETLYTLLELGANGPKFTEVEDIIGKPNKTHYIHLHCWFDETA